MLLCVLLAIAYPFFEAYHLTIDKHNLQTDLPANLKNLKIVFASDIHQSARYPQSDGQQSGAHHQQGLNADLVLLGGDYADDSDGAVFKNPPRIKPDLACSAWSAITTAMSVPILACW